MKRRLLYAASQAYEPELETMGRTVGWTARPIVVRRGSDRVLVGTVSEGVIVAFAGTLRPFHGGRHGGWTAVLDRLGDSAARLDHDAAYPGAVHHGFAAAMRGLWHDGPDGPGLRSAVQHALERGAARQLFVAGHGSGGALANLFAWRGAAEPRWRDLAVRVTSFGAPRTGDAAFAAAYARSRIVCLRYEAPGDPVPQLPAGPDTATWAHALAATAFRHVEPAGYCPVGVAMAPPEPGEGIAARLQQLVAAMRAGVLDWPALTPALIAAHAICPRSAYDRLVCTGEAHPCTHGAAPMPEHWRDAA